MMALGRGRAEVKVRGFFMRLIRAVADLRPKCIAIALGLIRIIGCNTPGPGYVGFRRYGN
jgi:hypothetical protein